MIHAQRKFVLNKKSQMPTFKLASIKSMYKDKIWVLEIKNTQCCAVTDFIETIIFACA